MVFWECYGFDSSPKLFGVSLLVCSSNSRNQGIMYASGKSAVQCTKIVLKKLGSLPRVPLEFTRLMLGNVLSCMQVGASKVLARVTHPPSVGGGFFKILIRFLGFHAPREQYPLH